jgi:hypothetical protein
MIQDAFKSKPDIIGIHSFLTEIEKRPALQVKWELMGYFAESVHDGFDGWDPLEATTLQRFMTDFIMNLESGTFEPETLVGAFGIDFANKN